MVIRRKLEVDELAQEDRVHYRVYTDPQVFDAEMERIFSHSWVYVAHESEVAQGGDYKTAYLGRRPVIVTRNPDDGQVYVLFNRCRHRGATVCQFETGNSSYFRCAYHGWTYNNTGKLVGVPYRQGYGVDFSPTDLGLVSLPRVEGYRGLIFATMNPNAPDLEEYLGDARPYIDAWIGQSPEGVMQVRGGVTKFAFNGNWKMQLENTVDGYHFVFVHQSYVELFEKRTGRKYGSLTKSTALDLGNGHSAIVLGDTVSQVGAGFVLTVFPNLQFLWSQIRVIRPVALDRTEVSLYHTVPVGAAEEIVRKRLAEQDDFYGPVGNAGPDDWEMFERCQSGLASGAADWVLFSRNYHDAASDRKGGPASQDESPQRAFYRQWRKLMNA